MVVGGGQPPTHLDPRDILLDVKDRMTLTHGNSFVTRIVDERHGVIEVSDYHGVLQRLQPQGKSETVEIRAVNHHNLHLIFSTLLNSESSGYGCYTFNHNVFLVDIPGVEAYPCNLLGFPHSFLFRILLGHIVLALLRDFELVELARHRLKLE